MITPNEVIINNRVFTRIVNNRTSYLVQNNSNYPIRIFASDVDLGSTVSNDLYTGYLIEYTKSITNEQLSNYGYVYAMSLSDIGKVNV